MKSILVTGSNGQLGSEIRRIADDYADFQFIYTDIDELDITHKNALNAYIHKNKIDCIINCAAYTAVDLAETNVDKCYSINRDAVKNIGQAAQENNIRVIHISTDYVFDGKSYIPYRENRETAPAGIYGKSKLAGEQVLKEVCPDAVIIRTSWLYSIYGNNFVKTMMKLGKEREVLNVVFDQIGTPTNAADLAKAIMDILSYGKWKSGIYHFSNEGVCSWYDFAKSIHRLAGIDCHVCPIESKDYPTPAPRPFYSVLNKEKIKVSFRLEIPHWEESLKTVIDNLNN